MCDADSSLNNSIGTLLMAALFSDCSMGDTNSPLNNLVGTSFGCMCVLIVCCCCRQGVLPLACAIVHICQPNGSPISLPSANDDDDDNTVSSFLLLPPNLIFLSQWESYPTAHYHYCDELLSLFSSSIKSLILSLVHPASHPPACTSQYIYILPYDHPSDTV